MSATSRILAPDDIYDTFGVTVEVELEVLRGNVRWRVGGAVASVVGVVPPTGPARRSDWPLGATCAPHSCVGPLMHLEVRIPFEGGGALFALEGSLCGMDGGHVHLEV